MTKRSCLIVCCLAVAALVGCSAGQQVNTEPSKFQVDNEYQGRRIGADLHVGDEVGIGKLEEYRYRFKNVGGPAGAIHIVLAGSAIDQNLIGELSNDISLVTPESVLVPGTSFKKTASGWDSTVDGSRASGFSIPKNAEFLVGLDFKALKAGSGQLEVEVSSPNGAATKVSDQLTISQPSQSENENTTSPMSESGETSTEK